MGDWFEEGLAFGCTRCGTCCSGRAGVGGTVRVSADEVARLALARELTEEAFLAVYTRPAGPGVISLRERANGDCVFYDPDVGCEVYAERPRQCRTWPFWRGNLATRAHWERAGRGCPGVGRGALHDAAEIRAALADDGTSGTIPLLDGSDGSR